MSSMDLHALMRSAAERLGEDRLHALLGVSWPQLEAWLRPDAIIPDGVFLKLADALSSAPAPAEAAAAAQTMQSILDAALEAAGTDLGNVQVLDAQGDLRIAAQRGFAPAFLDFFTAVSEPNSACGVAMLTGRQFVVPDVEHHPVFRGTAAREVMLAADACAVVSTPILGRRGMLLGILSVHYRAAAEPVESTLARLAAIARRAAALLEPPQAP